MNGISFNEGQAEISVWAPLARQVSLIIPEKNRDIPLVEQAGGYWTRTTPDISPGDRYFFQLNETKQLPDPASLMQPAGVHGASEAVKLADFPWTDHAWRNPDLGDYIIYEVHTGTFTAEGTFQAMEKKLDHLVTLGVTAVELMPVAQFPGNRNWGYDGVYPYAVQHSYGGARGLQSLVNACHRRGLAVILDVVYNHLGPEGNYLSEYAPFFTDKYRTPWGKAINFDDAWSDGVRAFFIENARMWFRDFHLDALRLDAVHAIRDFGPIHFLRELKENVEQLESETGNRHYLIAECDLNDERYLRPVQQDGYGMDAQWLDEFHHALRVSAGQEPIGYFADFNGLDHLAKAYQHAYVYNGIYSPHRKRKFGTRTDTIPGERFVVFSQNHDQVGNRMRGERTSQLHDPEMRKLLAGAVFCAPYLPLLFMGEEWSEPHPFLYFVSHSDPDLVAAVREGRQAEFAAFQLQGGPPDPQDEDTFNRSCLQWHLRDQEPHQTLFRYYQALIRFRKTHPALCKPNRAGLETLLFPRQQVLGLHRESNSSDSGAPHEVFCLLNFSSATQELTFPMTQTEDPHAQPWQLAFDSASTQWMGPADAPSSVQPDEPIRLQPASLTVYSRTRL